MKKIHFPARDSMIIFSLVVVGLALSAAVFAQVPDTTPPVVSCSVQMPILWPPNHELINVGINVVITDDQDPYPTWAIDCFSNEGDMEMTGGGRYSPDDKFGENGLRLRAERCGPGPGRCYLVVITGYDAAGNQAQACCSVVVPHDKSGRCLAAVWNMADEAEEAVGLGYLLPGWVHTGVGPVIGPKQ